MNRTLARRARDGLLAVLALASIGAADAHRGPGSVTRIVWNPRSELTEITHRLHVHDAAVGVAQVEGIERLDFASLEDRARAALYVEGRFAVQLDGETLTLRTLGAELRDDYLLIYQESDRRLSDGTLRVANDILRDAFTEQINEVNVHLPVGVRTLRFTGDDSWHGLAKH
ncbi:MAG: DUF6702 family protein [Pseudomonadota bacterium]